MSHLALGNHEDDAAKTVMSGSQSSLIISEQIVQESSGQMDRQKSYEAQTSDEVLDLERMIVEAAPTPRKAKRICNMSVFLCLGIRAATERVLPQK